MPELPPKADAPFDVQVEYARRHLLGWVANRAWVAEDEPSTLHPSVPLVWIQMWSAKLAEDAATRSQEAVERSTGALEQGVAVQRAGVKTQRASLAVVGLSVILSAVSLLVSAHLL